MEQKYERHFECSGCNKPVDCVYTEIVGKMMYRVGMCKDCPIMQKKLHGHLLEPSNTSPATGLTCGSCGATIDEIKLGSTIGCATCYDVFEDLILSDLSNSGRLAQKISGIKKIEAFHLGKIPGQTQGVNPALKLLSLHQALHDTLAREDYEQAAWLRDQIKALTQEQANGKQNA